MYLLVHTVRYARQILWKSPLARHPRSEEDPGVAPTSPPPAEPLAPSAPPSVVTLAGWLSCWGEAGAVVEEAGEGAGGRTLQSAPLFRDVKEGEKVGRAFVGAWINIRPLKYVFHFL